MASSTPASLQAEVRARDPELATLPPRPSLVGRMLASRVFVIGAFMILLVVMAALAAPIFAGVSPTKLSVVPIFGPPTWHTPMGGDDLGRSEWSRVLYGGRVTLGVSAAAVAIGLLVGTGLGVLAGYFGGAFDSVVMRFMDAVLAFPGLLLAIAIVSALGPGLPQATAAIGFVGIPAFARVARSRTLTVKHMPYVEAGKALGASHGRIMLHHILRNALPPIITLAATSAAGTILAVAGLSFVGLGAQPPTPDWGGMLAAGYPYLARAWWLSVFPGLGIAVASLGFVFLGDGLQDILDPRDLA